MTVNIFMDLWIHFSIFHVACQFSLVNQRLYYIYQLVKRNMENFYFSSDFKGFFANDSIWKMQVKLTAVVVGV